jgi:hypothetical protein
MKPRLAYEVHARGVRGRRGKLVKASVWAT